jgi:hypothetical protein
MSAAPARLLLHVGAPHCGSVALQTALSATPSLPTQDGQELRYTALSPQSGGWTVLSGRSLRMAAERSIKGCTATTAPAETDSAPFFAALDRVRRKAGRTVPVLSHPGWIGQADSFATALPHWFEGETETPVDICAFARPPLDWLNAAYWRWGIWSGRGFGSWLERLGTPYTLGAALTRWAALRGARVTLRLDADVLSGFDAACGTTLPRPARRPTPLPPALLGFLMRNRRYFSAGAMCRTRPASGRCCPATCALCVWPRSRIWTCFLRCCPQSRPRQCAPRRLAGPATHLTRHCYGVDGPLWRIPRNWPSSIAHWVVAWGWPQRRRENRCHNCSP